jgi:hypothetical protein
VERNILAKSFALNGIKRNIENQGKQAIG